MKDMLKVCNRKTRMEALQMQDEGFAKSELLEAPSELKDISDSFQATGNVLLMINASLAPAVSMVRTSPASAMVN